MSRLHQNLVGILLFLFSLVPIDNNPKTIAKDTLEYTKLDYLIKETSVLEVHGKTNINSFCCTSMESFENKTLNYFLDVEMGSVKMEGAKLKLTTNLLDCGKKVITKDMRKTLQSDKYPNIVLELKEIQNTKCHDLNSCDEWVDLWAIVDITLTCETNRYSFPVFAKKLDEHIFRVSGDTSLQLCDFDIEAPTALLGLIKVKDGLNISFDLLIELN